MKTSISSAAGSSFAAATGSAFAAATGSFFTAATGSALTSSTTGSGSEPGREAEPDATMASACAWGRNMRIPPMTTSVSAWSISSGFSTSAMAFSLGLSLPWNFKLVESRLASYPVGPSSSSAMLRMVPTSFLTAEPEGLLIRKPEES